MDKYFIDERFGRFKSLIGDILDRVNKRHFVSLIDDKDTVFQYIKQSGCKSGSEVEQMIHDSVRLDAAKITDEEIDKLKKYFDLFHEWIEIERL